MADKEIVILLLGPTRSGKTTFARCVGMPRDKGSDHGSTTECNEYKSHDGRFLIIDTPGLDDGPAGNLAVLYKIAEKLETAPEVNGVIYFHRATTLRLTGSARSNIDIAQRICGTQFRNRTVVCTTMWNTVSEQARGKFEKLDVELRRKTGNLTNQQSKLFRLNSNDPKTAGDVLEHFAALLKTSKSPARLQLAEQVGEYGSSPSSVRRTTAGRQIVKDLNRGLAGCTVL